VLDAHIYRNKCMLQNLLLLVSFKCEHNIRVSDCFLEDACWSMQTETYIILYIHICTYIQGSPHIAVSTIMLTKCVSSKTYIPRRKCKIKHTLIWNLQNEGYFCIIYLYLYIHIDIIISQTSIITSL